ncbi:efflux transporter outer membrane subunit [Paraburkholderia tropica]|uniref:Efflux transporter, outer membrane factor (OMF) lipoprotein, NodT family n=1 Tax=Paraburkholderia tropica TaxID=92647 RepID=A0AAQ1GIJ6_9BURK|nr:efflux transporter outer membrane subunit [Paraburkholderia tropica]SEJ99280.1 efflux transporter, outer membrane factor (OMF) lipoprotein, NodT family [Paraburkholderia tropica]
MKLAPFRIRNSLCMTLAVGVALLALQGCTVGPDYRRPDVVTPVAFKEAPKGWKSATPADAAARGDWWSVYHDPVLDSLVPQVAISNQNLKAYEAAYRQALAVVREARANLAPTVALAPGVTRSRSSNTTATTGSLEASASWDLDLWGKVRRQVESDKASAQASAAELADLTLSAQESLVSDYFSMRYQDSLTRLLNDTVKAYERSLDITRNQYEAGVAARSDVVTAQTTLATARASAIAAEALRDQYEHAIALLIGRPPSGLTIAPAELASEVPDVPLVVPSELLERRPDIAEAERTMAQENALIGVAVAAYYPTISLSGAAGYSGVLPLLSAANTLWSIAASGSETLIDGGARSAAVDAARASYDQSVANYRQTVLTAFHDVEDELSNLRVLGEQAVAQDEAVKLARQSVQISLDEYEAGTVTYTTVVTAQATALSNEQTALQVRSNRLIASASLIEALGGGWDASRLAGTETAQAPQASDDPQTLQTAQGR